MVQPSKAEILGTWAKSSLLNAANEWLTLLPRSLPLSDLTLGGVWASNLAHSTWSSCKDMSLGWVLP